MAKKKEKPKKHFDCKTCNENTNNHCSLKVKDKPTDYSKIENIQSCEFYRKSK